MEVPAGVRPPGPSLRSAFDVIEESGWEHCMKLVSAVMASEPLDGCVALVQALKWHFDNICETEPTTAVCHHLIKGYWST